MAVILGCWCCRCHGRCTNTWLLSPSRRSTSTRSDGDRPGAECSCAARSHRGLQQDCRSDQTVPTSCLPPVGRWGTVTTLPASGAGAAARCCGISSALPFLGGSKLVLRGVLNRVLLIAPRSLIRQWMEELREKFALTAWFSMGTACATLTDASGGPSVPGRKTASSLSPVILLRALIAAPVSSPSSAHGMRCWWTKPMRPGAGCLAMDRISCSDCCRCSVPGACFAASGC